MRCFFGKNLEWWSSWWLSLLLSVQSMEIGWDSWSYSPHAVGHTNTNRQFLSTRRCVVTQKAPFTVLCRYSPWHTREPADTDLPSSCPLLCGCWCGTAHVGEMVMAVWMPPVQRERLVWICLIPALWCIPGKGCFHGKESCFSCLVLPGSKRVPMGGCSRAAYSRDAQDKQTQARVFNSNYLPVEKVGVSIWNMFVTPSFHCCLTPSVQKQ